MADIFAKLGDIQGESLDDKHRDEIEVMSWSWGVSQSAPASPGGGGSGKTTFHDFNFTHTVDKASPNLLKACATGAHLKEATITVRKAGNAAQDYMIIKMSDVLVTGVAASGSADGATTAEHVTLQFGKVQLEYRPQKPDGSLDAPVVFKYDVKAHREG